MELLKDLKKFINTMDTDKFIEDVKTDEEFIPPFDWTGLEHTPETKKRIRDTKLGKKMSAATKKKMSKQRQHKMWITDGTNDFWVDRDTTIPTGKRRGRSTAKKRAPMSEEQKKKISLVRTGKKHSKETKLKMGQSRLGNQNARKKTLNSLMKRDIN